MDLTTILPHLPERYRARLPGIADQLEAAVAAGMVPNRLFTDAKSTINWCVEKGSEAFLATGPRTKAHHMGDWWLLAYKSDAFVHGAHSLPTALKRAEKAAMTEYAGFLASILPLQQLLQSAKPLIRKRNELPKVVSAKQIEKMAKAMTCQCCGRQIFAETGRIAHHGYERPGHGWQTASCFGAQHLPFEVSRHALGDLITIMHQNKADLVDAVANVKAERGELAVTLTDFNAPLDRNGYRPTKTVYVTRGFFAEVYAEHAKAFDRRGLTSFDQVKTDKLADLARDIKNITEEIAGQTARFDGWTQTHKWDKAAKAWAPLSKEE